MWHQRCWFCLKSKVLHFKNTLKELVDRAKHPIMLTVWWYFLWSLIDLTCCVPHHYSWFKQPVSQIPALSPTFPWLLRQTVKILRDLIIDFEYWWELQLFNTTIVASEEAILTGRFSSKNMETSDKNPGQRLKYNLQSISKKWSKWGPKEPKVWKRTVQHSALQFFGRLFWTYCNSE